MSTLCANCEKEIVKIGDCWFHQGQPIAGGMDCKLTATPQFESLLRELDIHKKACDCFNDVVCAERVRWLWKEINNALGGSGKSLE